MVLNTIDMLQWTDKKLTTCLILLLLELFLDGKFVYGDILMSNENG